jgi:hypothetical protein
VFVGFDRHAFTAGARHGKRPDDERERTDPNLVLAFQNLAFLPALAVWLLGGYRSIGK